ncbi:MAG: hypothetical protein ACKOAD_01130 [Gammaproteobacteria bacterium]
MLKAGDLIFWLHPERPILGHVAVCVSNNEDNKNPKLIRILHSTNHPEINQVAQTHLLSNEHVRQNIRYFVVRPRNSKFLGIFKKILFILYQYGIHFSEPQLEKLSNFNENHPDTEWQYKINRQLFIQQNLQKNLSAISNQSHLELFKISRQGLTCSGFMSLALQLSFLIYQKLPKRLELDFNFCSPALLFENLIMQASFFKHLGCLVFKYQLSETEKNALHQEIGLKALEIKKRKASIFNQYSILHKEISSTHEAYSSSTAPKPQY